MCPDCDYDLVVNTWHVCKVDGEGSYDTWNIIFRSSKYQHYLGVPKELSSRDNAREFLFNHLKDGVGAFLKSPVDKASLV